jgi:hypothetical protein
MEEGESTWGDGLALWVNGKQVANYMPDGRLELRLTKPVIRELKERLSEDEAIDLRRNSDWVTMRISPDDQELVLELARRVVAAHAPADGAIPKPVPTGPAMARRKRFH